MELIHCMRMKVQITIMKREHILAFVCLGMIRIPLWLLVNEVVSMRGIEPERNLKIVKIALSSDGKSNVTEKSVVYKGEELKIVFL